MVNPKKKMGGDLVRTTITPGKGKDNYPLGRSQEFEMDGYHSNPNTGKAGNTKHSKISTLKIDLISLSTLSRVNSNG